MKLWISTIFITSYHPHNRNSFVLFKSVFMLFTNASTGTVRRSLQSICNGGYIKDGADYAKDNPLKEFVVWLKSLFSDDVKTKIQAKENRLQLKTKQITENIINAKPDPNGDYTCTVQYGIKSFSVSQRANSGHVEITDLETKETLPFKSVPFSHIQKQLLVQYIQEQRDLGLALNLSSFDLSHIDLSSVDFSHTVLSRKNFDAIINSGGNLAGATLAAGEDVTNLNLARVSLDNTMAVSLIGAGADFKTVLVNYLATKPGWLSQQFKTKLLIKYLEAERRDERLPIDLSMFDLSDVRVKDVRFDNTKLSSSHLKTIITGGGKLEGASIERVPGVIFDEAGMSKSKALQLIKAGLETKSILIAYLASERSQGRGNIDISEFDLTGIDLQSINHRNVDLSSVKIEKTEGYKDRVKANFEQDLLTMLNIYAQTVASIIVKSPTKDMFNAANGVSIEKDKYNAHIFTVENYIRKMRTTITDGIEPSLKSSTGNCGEMANIGMSMLDLYLEKTLNLLGYQNFSVVISKRHAKAPSDHGIVKLKCSFQGKSTAYIIDPWSENGKAWRYTNGLQYFRTQKEGRFIKKNIKFSVDRGATASLKAQKEKISTIFDKFSVKEQLYSLLAQNESQFVGMPVA